MNEYLVNSGESVGDKNVFGYQGVQNVDFEPVGIKKENNYLATDLFFRQFFER